MRSAPKIGDIWPPKTSTPKSCLGIYFQSFPDFVDFVDIWWPSNRRWGPLRRNICGRIFQNGYKKWFWEIKRPRRASKVNFTLYGQVMFSKNHELFVFSDKKHTFLYFFYCVIGVPRSQKILSATNRAKQAYLTCAPKNRQHLTP